MKTCELVTAIPYQNMDLERAHNKDIFVYRTSKINIELLILVDGKPVRISREEALMQGFLKVKIY